MIVSAVGKVPRMHKGIFTHPADPGRWGHLPPFDKVHAPLRSNPGPVTAHLGHLWNMEYAHLHTNRINKLR